VQPPAARRLGAPKPLDHAVLKHRHRRLDYGAIEIYADILRYWDLFSDLFRRDFAVRFRGSTIGIAWTLINPLILMGVYTILFSVLMKVPGVEGISNFPLFVLTGLLVWIFFAASVQTSTGSLVGNATLVKQVRFPRQLLPLSVVAANVVTLTAMLLVILPFTLWLLPDTRTTFWASALLLVPLIGFASGLAIFVACANALYRDVEHIVTALLLPWFLLTPIFWSFDSLPGLQNKQALVDILYYGNPLVPIVEGLRDPLFFGEMPSMGNVVYSFGVAVGALVLGALVFRRVDDRLVAEL
jgi:ABC-type polysaccharide/polyol phosphate export permease